MKMMYLNKQYIQMQSSESEHAQTDLLNKTHKPITAHFVSNHETIETVNANMLVLFYWQTLRVSVSFKLSFKSLFNFFILKNN